MTHPFDPFAMDPVRTRETVTPVEIENLGADQAAAAAMMPDFINDDDATIMALLGYAGTGKTYTLAKLLQAYVLGDETLFGCPTHKAMWVGRRFLDESGIEYESGYDKFHHRYGVPVTGTTAQLIGLRPVITDDQSAKKQNFGQVSGGLLEKMPGVRWIVIDEISMVSKAQLQQVERIARGMGAKVLVVGDPGQLPPVEAEAIDFDAFRYKAVLEKIMRQSGDSAVPQLAAAIRDGRDWSQVSGSGVDHFHNPAGAFIDELDGPPAEDERERSVFVAYRNARVNAVQEAACRKVYGHGRLEFAPGEVVIASRPLRSGPVALCNNGDTLRIAEVFGQGQWGTEIRVENMNGGGFYTEFLNEAQLADPGHPFNVELNARRDKANMLQKAYARGDRAVNDERRQAWARFFELENSTVLSAAHPFAITSHKSQGSTYDTVFVDAKDMQGFDPRALYVGATRPSKELIIG